MSLARLIIEAHVTGGLSKSAIARESGISRWCVQQVVRRFELEGPAGFEPRSRRPHSSPQAVSAEVEDQIIRFRKELSKQGLDAGAETIAAHLARRSSGRGSHPVPAVSTIWRILVRRVSSPHSPTNAPDRRGSASRPSSPTNAGRPTPRTGS